MSHDNDVPIPPTSAERHSTACRYCIVGCGYEVFKWPAGEEGGPSADENAFGIDFPAQALGGNGITTEMHTVIEENGEEYNVIVKPDDDNPVNNQWSSGDHSVRGGSIAQSLYSPENDTEDRLKYPQIRIGGTLQPVDWETAIKAVAKANELAMDRNGPNGVGQKLYFYQFVENTYAGTKLHFDVIGSPNWGGHNRPALTPENPGMRNAGLWQFAYDYEDTQKADNVVMVGAEFYENKSIIFQEHIQLGVQDGATPVHIDPRQTFTSNYSQNNDGMHLQLEVGTDAVLLSSVARHILEQGWENTEFIEEWTMRERSTIDDEGWYQKEFGQTFEEYQDAILDEPRYKPENAAEITGIPAEDIRSFAELIGKPDENGERPNTVFLWEKGLIWGFSHENSAALGNLVLLTGSVGRPGAGLSRGGGHQEGFWVGGPAGEAIGEHSTQTFTTSDGEEVTIAPDTDERVRNGEILHWHVIGCDPVRGSYNTQQLRNAVRERTSGPQPQSADAEEIARAWAERMDQGGMVLTNQEIYPRTTTEFADIVLPATTWGEESDYHRWNGERRLRQYSGFMEGPGEAKPDWEIFSMIGQEMGATDMNWGSADEIFEEIASEADHGVHALKAIHDKAQEEGKTTAEKVSEMDTTGIQLPARLEDGELVGTDRVHQPDEKVPGSGRFFTSTGDAIFMQVDWNRVEDVYEELKPDPSNDEIWVTNGRVNRLWQNLYSHTRDPQIIKRFKQNFIELNPADADRIGVEAGDLVEIRNDDVYNMYGENTEGSFTAIAYVTEDPPQGQIVPEGTAFTYWLYPGQVANDIAPAYLDPANPNPSYKLAAGEVVRLGESELKEEMSFQARNIAPE